MKNTKQKLKKLDLRSMSITEDQKKKLRQLFPEVFNEKNIDWERLKTTLGEILDKEVERYHISWPGKADCFRIIQEQSLGTLKPCKKESLDWEKTQNLFIEGDNLEVLKLLQHSYYGKIKMIYIDPPYNTGKDFIYPDKYSESLDTYLKYTGQKDIEGKRFSTNQETDGRFHSNWLNMMYPRLFLARNLLRDDGVIFISIDDNEVANLRKICDEIFGEENFIGCAGRITKKSNNKGDFWAPNFDYILTYTKNIDNAKPFFGGVNTKAYNLVEQTGARKGEKYQLVRLFMSTIQNRNPEQRFWIKCPNGDEVIPPGSTFPPERPVLGDGIWRWTKKKFKADQDKIVIKETRSSNLIDKNKKPAKYNVFTKTYLLDVINNASAKPNSLIENHINQKGSHELDALNIPFDYSKPTCLIKYLIEVSRTDKDDIILDFFAGSGTTAHAVYEKNLEDGGSRKYICVQLPEPTQEDTSAYKEGYKTIADIGKERIRRAIKKIKETENKNSLKTKNQKASSSLENQQAGLFPAINKKDKNPPKEIQNNWDLGFKVFKLDKSNFKIWNEQISKDSSGQIKMQLEELIDKKSTTEDLLYEILIKTGYLLTTKIKILKMSGKTVYSIENNALLVCLEKRITKELIQEMAKLEPARVLCLDKSFEGNDWLKTNAKDTFDSFGVRDFRVI